MLSAPGAAGELGQVGDGAVSGGCPSPFPAEPKQLCACPAAIEGNGGGGGVEAPSSRSRLTVLVTGGTQGHRADAGRPRAMWRRSCAPRRVTATATAHRRSALRPTGMSWPHGPVILQQGAQLRLRLTCRGGDWCNYLRVWMTTLTEKKTLVMRKSQLSIRTSKFK